MAYLYDIKISNLQCISNFKLFLSSGKSRNPRCFKNVDRNELGVKWHANRRAWMKTLLFKDNRQLTIHDFFKHYKC